MILEVAPDHTWQWLAIRSIADKIGLHLLEALAPLRTTLHTQVFVDQSPMEALDDPVALRPSHARTLVLDVVELQQELVGVERPIPWTQG